MRFSTGHVTDQVRFFSQVLCASFNFKLFELGCHFFLANSLLLSFPLPIERTKIPFASGHCVLLFSHPPEAMAQSHGRWKLRRFVDRHFPAEPEVPRDPIFCDTPALLASKPLVMSTSGSSSTSPAEELLYFSGRGVVRSGVHDERPARMCSRGRGHATSVHLEKVPAGRVPQTSTKRKWDSTLVSELPQIGYDVIHVVSARPQDWRTCTVFVREDATMEHLIGLVNDQPGKHPFFRVQDAKTGENHHRHVRIHSVLRESNLTVTVSPAVWNM